MQIRCQHCQKPFALAREAVVAALENLEEHQLHHYNAICPHCGRTNRVSQKALRRAAPQWRASRPTESGAEDVCEKSA
ncbi:MAG: hypothetical protein DDG59_01395 [Anaerolineae bacterium]|jgi:phage FluMu protein Com|nr:MAG: hypothetical protein DDG59_01395 [Anaerolineae bacterium]